MRLTYGKISVEPIESPVPAICLHGDDWLNLSEDGSGVVTVTRPLFDKIPKVNIPEIEELAPDHFFDADVFDFINSNCKGEAVYIGIGMISGLMKIGFSSRWDDQRRNSYRTESAERIDFRIMPAGREIERLLHELFGPVRVSRSREWFYPHPALISYMLKMD